ADVRFTIHHMRCRVLLYSVIKISFCDLFPVFIIRQKVGHPTQGLAAGKWPYSPIPFTAVSGSTRSEGRFSAFGGCQTPGSLKSGGIDHLRPSSSIASLIRY